MRAFRPQMDELDVDEAMAAEFAMEAERRALAGTRRGQEVDLSANPVMLFMQSLLPWNRVPHGQQGQEQGSDVDEDDPQMEDYAEEDAP